MLFTAIPEGLITYPLYPLKDGKGKVQLVDYMGGELDVVNDAKASFERESTSLGEKELKLLNFLLTSKPIHSSPLRGTIFKFKVKATLYTTRQIFKHLVGSNFKDEQFQWNEKSLRYSLVNDEGDYYVPETFCYQSDTNKQGSGSPMPLELQKDLRERWIKFADISFKTYQSFIKEGVSREDARGMLAPCFYTSFVWTTSLQALLHFLTLRKESTAQAEIQKYANALTLLVKPIIPNILEIMGLDFDLKSI